MQTWQGNRFEALEITEYGDTLVAAFFDRDQALEAAGLDTG